MAVHPHEVFKDLLRFAGSAKSRSRVLRERAIMRVSSATRHLQRSHNVKFLLSTSNGQPESPVGEESVSPPPVAFPSCEPRVPVTHPGPTLLGERFLLLGPAEGSALYKCVDTHTGEQLVAKVGFFFSFTLNTLR